MSKFSLKRAVRNWIYRTLEKPESPIKQRLQSIEDRTHTIEDETHAIEDETHAIENRIHSIEESLRVYSNQTSQKILDETLTMNLCCQYLTKYHAKELQTCKPDHFVSYYYESSINCANLGDYIQTIATEKAINKCTDITNLKFEYVLRNKLTDHRGGICVMQGWYEHQQLTFLPGPDTRPVWVGTHFTNDVRKLFSYLYKHFEIRFEDIGCRDKSTLEFLWSLGITAYFSRCLTLTLPKRTWEEDENADTVYIVDCSTEIVNSLPNEMKSNAKIIEQRIFKCYPWQDWRQCRKAAEDLLEEYKKKAKLVITTALHCAQPCIAMGIPVVFINPEIEEADRFSSMEGIIPIYSIQDLKDGKITYPTKAPDIEDLKLAILNNLTLSIKESLSDKELRQRQDIRLFIDKYNLLSN